MARLVTFLVTIFLATILLVNGDEDVTKLIVGGERATEIHPYRVSLRRINWPNWDPDWHGAGGSILNSRWILVVSIKLIYKWIYMGFDTIINYILIGCTFHWKL